MSKKPINVDIGKIVIDTFHKAVNYIIDCKYTRFVFKGGRNSTKSSMIAFSIILGVLINQADAVCMVKYNNRVYERLVSTFLEMLNRSGLYGFFKYKQRAQELVLLDGWKGKETNHSIKFTGVDDPSKLKSMKPRSGNGGFRYVWFEEAYDFETKAEVDNVINTMGRGEGKHCVIISYNPPKSRKNWLNQEYNVPCGKVLGHDKNSYVTRFETSYTNELGLAVNIVETQYVHHSTYLDVIESGHSNWLGLTLINAEKNREKHPENYRWEYLGEAIGNEGNVFKNVKILTNDIVFDKSVIDRGLDFGFTTDPCSYVEWCYSKLENSLYCVGEFMEKGVSNETLANEINLRNKHHFRVWCDSAEPRTINELNKLGVKAVGVIKGADSVRHGIKWLQDLDAIYIDPITCPKTYKEFVEYEYKKDKLGEYTGELMDKDNHSIDATRYAECTRIG